MRAHQASFCVPGSQYSCFVSPIIRFAVPTYRHHCSGLSAALQRVNILPRHIRPDVEDALGGSRVVALVGPRQAGKSTLASQVARDVLRTTLVSLDDDSMGSFAQSDPTAFIASLPLPAALDEVQRAPGASS